MAIQTLDDLVSAVQDEMPSESKNLVKNVLRSAFDAINAKTAAGETVRIYNFGTFQTKTRAARTGRNPQTGEAIQIAESTTLGFKPTKHGK